MLNDADDEDATVRVVRLTNCRRWHLQRADEAVGIDDTDAAHRHHRIALELAHQLDALERGV